jgi:transaldolase
MNATQSLHELGQSLWLDNLTRDLLRSGTLARYIRELSVTGLTSNPTILGARASTTTRSPPGCSVKASTPSPPRGTPC